MRKRQPVPAPQPEEVDEYAAVKIPFDDVLRKLGRVPAAGAKTPAKKTIPANKS